MDQVKVGIIGSGYWGPNLIRNFVELPSSKVVAVADLDEGRLSEIKAHYPTIEVTKDYRDFFTMPIDTVVIATPPASHFRIAKECLQAGRHVMVEKPMTLNVRDAEELIMIAERHHRTLMVGHTFEYNPAVQALKELIQSGAIGPVSYIDAVRVNLGLFQRGLNVLWDLAPHDISILIYLLGQEPISVNALGGCCINPNLHDVVYLHLIFPGNVLAHIHISWLDPCKVRRVTVVGRRKMVVYDDVETQEKLRIYDKGVETVPYTDNFGDFQCSYRYGDIVTPYVRFIEPLRLECQHFIDCVINDTVPRSDGYDGLRVVKVLEMAERSLRNSGHREYFESPAYLEEGHNEGSAA